MPANVTPEYRAAEARYRMATSPEAQLVALQEMLSTIPKHKGTEKMQADIKRRISEQKREHALRRKAGHRPFFLVERAEGSQTVLVGPTNSGKSLLLARLTNAEPEVAAYPFTTRVPVPGMMPYEDVMLQIVDLPAVSRGGSEPWVFDLVRRADVALLVVDAASDDLLAEMDELLQLLDAKGIDLVPAWGRAGVEEEHVLPKRALVVANKMDLAGAGGNSEVLDGLSSARFPVVKVSAETGQGLEALRGAIYRAADVIRVYTKAPGTQAERTKPFLLPTGSTVLEAARTP
jgi:ribosome-interacting GTPase 1